MRNSVIFGENRTDGYIRFAWDIADNRVYIGGFGTIQSFEATPTNLATVMYTEDLDEFDTLENSDMSADPATISDTLTGSARMTQMVAEATIGMIHLWLDNLDIAPEAGVYVANAFKALAMGQTTLLTTYGQIKEIMGEEFIWGKKNI